MFALLKISYKHLFSECAFVYYIHEVIKYKIAPQRAYKEGMQLIVLDKKKRVSKE
jgi:hypothetical protein